VGERSGTPVEDLGVVGDPYWLTRDDILDGNKDLLEFAARKLAKRPTRRLDIDAKRDPDGNVLLEFVRVVGLERVDVFIDERPQGSFDPKVANGPPSFAAAAAPCNVRAFGYAGQKLAAACTVHVDAAGAGGD
jgi:hypothetical protein